MTRATATWTNTELADFVAGMFLREPKFREQLLQNIEYLAQTHNHDGDPGDGGLMPTANGAYIWAISAAAVS